MSVILGTGEHRYRVVENWAKLPDGWEFRDVAAVAVDSKDRVYVFNRGQHPMMVFDRYGNSCVHKYSPDGKHLTCWGTTGTDPGQFNIPHNIATDDDGWVYVADRENHRVQVFDGNGKYESQWNNMHRPCALYCCAGGGNDPKFIIGELGPGMRVNAKHTNIGPRLTIIDKKGGVIARLGGEHGPGQEPGKFLSPHGLAVDSKGDIYVGEVSYTNWSGTHPDVPVPKYLRSLQKLEKVA